MCACVCVVHWHCSAQLSMFNMEKRYRNKIIIIIIITIEVCVQTYIYLQTLYVVVFEAPLVTEVCVRLLVGCLTSQQQASVSQGRICTDNFTCCHTEIEVADQTFYLTQSQYTDTGPISPSADPITPGAWQGSHWSANF